LPTLLIRIQALTATMGRALMLLVTELKAMGSAGAANVAQGYHPTVEASKLADQFRSSIQGPPYAMTEIQRVWVMPVLQSLRGVNNG
jgi:hypothetical protein